MLLSSRSHIVAFSTNTDSASSTGNNTFKTPANSLKVARSLRNENAAYSQMTSVKGRKKTVIFNTPAAGASLKPSLQREKGPPQMHRAGALAEITNRTPFLKQNLPITPDLASVKPSRSFMIFDDSAAISLPRVSSTRKKLRLPRSPSKSFETPDTAGNHWDVSDVSMDESIMEEVSLNQADYGDVEYLPPTAIEPAYDPEFDAPNYKDVGVTLLSLFRAMSIETSEEENPIDILKGIGVLAWEALELSDLPEDEVFMPVNLNLEQPNPLDLASSCLAQTVTSSTAWQHMDSITNPLKTAAPTFRKLNRPVLHPVPVRTNPMGTNARVVTVTRTRIPTLSKTFTTTTNDRSARRIPTNMKLTRLGSTVAEDAIRHSRVTPVASARVGGVQNRSKNVIRVAPLAPNILSQRTSPSVIPDDTMVDLFAGKTNEETDNGFLFSL